MYSPRTAAQNLLLVISQKKRKAHLPALMAHIAAALSAHDAAAREAAAAGQPGRVPPKVARTMDGALLAIGTCADALKSKAPYRDNVEAMLTQFVAPCFDSAYGHLRAKACWVSKEFCDFAGFSGGEGESGRGPQFCGLFERVMRALSDAELPVRVDAVVALRSFVEELADLDVLRPVLPSLLDAVFALMAEVDNEDLVFTLEGIVEKFGDGIAPYATGLARSLAAAFWKYVSATEGDGDDDDADTGAYFAAWVWAMRLLSSMAGRGRGNRTACGTAGGGACKCPCLVQPSRGNPLPQVSIQPRSASKLLTLSLLKPHTLSLLLPRINRTLAQLQWLLLAASAP
jgi:hypothetical protein